MIYLIATSIHIYFLPNHIRTPYYLDIVLELLLRSITVIYNMIVTTVTTGLERGNLILACFALSLLGIKQQDISRAPHTVEQHKERYHPLDNFVPVDTCWLASARWGGGEAICYRKAHKMLDAEAKGRAAHDQTSCRVAA